MHIRDVVTSDHDGWQALWEGYIRFYEADVAPSVTLHTWQRIIAPSSPLVGRIAERDGRLIGMSNCVLHEGTWTIEPVLYLEDLFVAPDARSSGIGQALMEDAIAQARVRGCSRVYWHTRASNAAARRLYDRFVTADDFVRYRILLA